MSPRSPVPPPHKERLAWAVPGLGLAALGLDTSAPLFEPGPALSARLEPLASTPGRRRLRFPLPGTPDARGNLSGRPGPLGTGWLWLSAFEGRLGELLRARCTPPRSASRAEREWNLLCHLRAHGVGTPEPLLVGARGAGFVSARSFLLVRAPEDAFPLPRWLRTDGIGAERARGLRSLGLSLALIARAGLRPAALRAEHLWLTPSGSGECETHGDGAGPRKNKLPSVLLVEVGGARLASGPRADAAWLEPLLADLGPSLEPAERAALLAAATARV